MTAIRAAEDMRAPTPSDLALLVHHAGSSNVRVQRSAIRALGRLERRDVVSVLLPYLRSGHVDVRTETAFAIAQAVKGPPLPVDSGGSQVDGVLSALAGAAMTEQEAGPLGELARSVARLPFERPQQVAGAERLVRELLTLSKQLMLARKRPGDAAPALLGGIAGAELLARLHGKLSPPSQELIALLRAHVKGEVATVPRQDAPPPSKALHALIVARGVDEDTLRFSLHSSDEHVRRLAVTVLTAGGSPITGPDRAALLQEALKDRSFFVRFEAIRGYARTLAASDGCGPLLDAVTDSNLHVALAALDGIGDACRGEGNAVQRAIGEARTPPTTGLWHRESHALVALAKLSPAHAQIPLLAHSRHQVWQVRMYAARAASILDDVPTLERLADDPNDNVREATLGALKRLKKGGSESHFISAFGRSDYQLVLTAANESSGLPATRPLVLALVDALKRITAEKKETSRDPRMAMIKRLRELGSPDANGALTELLRDFDPEIADAAANTLRALTGQAVVADPQLLHLQPQPTPAEIATLENSVAVLVMQRGRNIELQFDPEVAPLTAVRFLRLAEGNYFDGLTFHRVVPNFVVQGGSPGANEYAGDGPYLRDEISRRSHVPGTIGLSTRGRDTGDAQIFFNLVANPRLDFEYTIFGEVVPSSLSRMWDILEGDVIVDIRWKSKGAN